MTIRDHHCVTNGKADGPFQLEPHDAATGWKMNRRISSRYSAPVTAAQKMRQWNATSTGQGFSLSVRASMIVS